MISGLTHEMVEKKNASFPPFFYLFIIFSLLIEKIYHLSKEDVKLFCIVMTLESFFFFIRNEEDYINKRTNTGEKKETKEREKKPREG